LFCFVDNHLFHKVDRHLLILNSKLITKKNQNDNNDEEARTTSLTSLSHDDQLAYCRSRTSFQIAIDLFHKLDPDKYKH